LPTREQINGFFCKALAAGFSGGWHAIGCDNTTELDVSHMNPDYLEWNDKELQVTSTGQVNTAPECIAAGAHVSKTVHNFSHDMTSAHMAAIAEKRKDPTTFLPSVIANAPLISGFIAPSDTWAPGNPRFLGAQFGVPRPPGCRAGRFIPGCPNPPVASEDELAVAAAAAPTGPIGLIERYQVMTEGQCFAIVTIYFPAKIDDMMTPREKMPLIVWYAATAASTTSPPAAATQWATTGHAFAVVELCGKYCTQAIILGSIKRRNFL
jgi:hypothetical protein